MSVFFLKVISKLSNSFLLVFLIFIEIFDDILNFLFDLLRLVNLVFLFIPLVLLKTPNFNILPLRYQHVLWPLPALWSIAQFLKYEPSVKLSRNIHNNRFIDLQPVDNRLSRKSNLVVFRLDFNKIGIFSVLSMGLDEFKFNLVWIFPWVFLEHLV